MDTLFSNEALPAIVVAVVLVVATTLYVLRDPHPPALSPEFKDYVLAEKEDLSHDTRRFTFALPSPNHKLGLPIGQHMSLAFTDPDGKTHQRSYTPVTSDKDFGKVSFVIKVYKAGVHPKFPDGGKVSQHLDRLKIGETIKMKGPKGHLTWLGKGKFTVKLMKKPLEKREATHIGMIAGGTGITPMLQVIHAIFDNPSDKTVIKLLYANQCKLSPNLTACKRQVHQIFGRGGIQMNDTHPLLTFLLL
jgi:cytochrome-b5 reductase